jgi:hypothetical protein
MDPEMGSTWRKTKLSASVLLSIGLPLAACSASDGHSVDPPSTRAPPAAIPVPGATIPPTPVRLIAIVEDAAAASSPESDVRDAGAGADGG